MTTRRQRWAWRWHLLRYHDREWARARRLDVPLVLLQAAHALWRVGDEDCAGYSEQARNEPLHAVTTAAEDGADLDVVADLIAVVTQAEGRGYEVRDLMREFKRATARNRFESPNEPSLQAWSAQFRWDQEYVKYHEARMGGSTAHAYVSNRVPFAIGQHRYPTSSLTLWPLLVRRCRNFTQPDMDWAALVADRAPLLRHVPWHALDALSEALAWADLFGTDRTILFLKAGLTYDEAAACDPDQDETLRMLAGLRRADGAA